MRFVLHGSSLLILSELTVIAVAFRCNYIKETDASSVTSQMLSEEACRGEDACVTNVDDGVLSMGCLDVVKHWEYILLCFKAPDNKTTICSYDPKTRDGFDHWGTGMCCCRQEMCNELPPEWLALPKWRARYRAICVHVVFFTLCSIVFIIWGKIEAYFKSKHEKRRKKILKKSGHE
ncbi:hypothetical protein Q1695_002722 [Nippostrongylus brasiliensis]|nr:hypothetical protein Q1695_002722 [Nippostrongylus brasiliensis]